MQQHHFAPTEFSSESMFKMPTEAKVGVSGCSARSDSAEEGCALGRHSAIPLLIYQKA